MSSKLQIAEKVAGICELFAKRLRNDPLFLDEIATPEMIDVVVDGLATGFLEGIKSGKIGKMDVKNIVSAFAPYIKFLTLFEDVKTALGEELTKKPQKLLKKPMTLDIFGIFSRSGRKELNQKLISLDIEQLKRIVAHEGFDPARLAPKWKNKERLVKLIIDRVEARSKKGDVFMKH